MRGRRLCEGREQGGRGMQPRSQGLRATARADTRRRQGLRAQPDTREEAGTEGHSQTPGGGREERRPSRGLWVCVGASCPPGPVPGL